MNLNKLISTLNKKIRIHQKGKEYLIGLWFRFKSGDRYAFGEIYNEFIVSLFAYGMKITGDKELVKDCIQDLFIDLYRYDINLKKPESLEFYLFKSLKRLINHKLINSRRLEYFEEENSLDYDLKYDLEENFINVEINCTSKRNLQHALNSLNPKSKELLFYKFHSNLSYKKIGILTGVKADTAKKRIYRIIKGLRANYKYRIPVN